MTNRQGWASITAIASHGAMTAPGVAQSILGGVVTLLFIIGWCQEKSA